MDLLLFVVVEPEGAMKAEDIFADLVDDVRVDGREDG